MKKLDAFQIKLFMVGLMVFDYLHIITRCVGVWFGYMAVEGFC